MSGGGNSREWPVWLVWLLLVLASLGGFFMAEGLVGPKLAASLAFVLAAIKIHVVFDQYMELNWRHRPLRQLLAAWLAVVTAILLGTYWMT